jgi:hypothetical protein
LIHLRSTRSHHRWLLAGAASGALSSLVLHHGAFALLHSPWLVPFWGAAWGALAAIALGRMKGARLVLGAVAFGAVLPTLAAFLLVAPLRGQPTVTGVVPLVLIGAVLVNAAWGLGTGIGLLLLGRPRARPKSRYTPTG